jgi:hypothetical protein
MIWIKYSPNQQGIAEVEIQPQLVDGLKKKNKRLEQNSSKPTKVSPKAIPSPSKKKVEKPLKEAPKSTTTPATKKKRRCGRPRRNPYPLPRVWRTLH